MSGVFKKLLRKEFGTIKYESYFQTVQENLRVQKTDSAILYEALYEELKQRDKEVILGMNERLNEAMLLAFRISKTYGFAFAIYLATFFTLAFLAAGQIAVPVLLVISVFFLIKTYEYIVNRFSHIDTYITLIYKSVLERVIVDLESGKT